MKYSEKSIRRSKSNIFFKVKVLAISDTGSIITSGVNGFFEYGVVFQHSILYNSIPLPIDTSSRFALSNIKVGDEICIIVNHYNNISGIKVAISSVEIKVANVEDEKIYYQMEVGKSYCLEVYDFNKEYVTLRVPGTALRGYIEKKAIANPEIGQEYNLRLAQKGNSVFQFMAFELEVPAPQDSLDNCHEVDIDSLYQRMFKQELSLISEEDQTLIKELLTDYPKVDRYNRYLADIQHLYCRCTPQAYIAYEEFCKVYPKYLNEHNFFITSNLEEKSFTIFDSAYVVFKLYGEGEYLWLKEFYYDKKNIRAKNICDENKNRKLIIEGYKIHILDSYNAIPHSFNWGAIMRYTNRMADFYYITLKKIDSDYQKKQSEESQEFSILRDYLEYEKDLEKRKDGQYIRINESYAIERAPLFDYESGVAYKFKLDYSNYESLCGIMEADEELYVSLYDPAKKSEPIRNGKMIYDETTSIAHIEFRKETEKALLRNGYLKKRNSTEHLDIQIDAINSLFRAKEKKFYNSIFPSEFESPDISSYNNIRFLDTNINNAGIGNNQPLAVQKALGNRQVLLIQGPPGTGKTTVIIEIIRQLAKERKRVLVCSQTHAAVRNIIDKLAKYKNELSFISIENDGEEEAWGVGFDIEEYKSFLNNNRLLIQQLISGEIIDREYIKNHYKYKSKNAEKYISYHNYILDYYTEANGLYKNADSILSHLLSEASITGYLLDSYRYQIQDVILGTCIGIGMNRNVKSIHFDTVIIDEAAKANLAESLVPMKLGDRYILVGDDKQLPPYTDRQMISEYVRYHNSRGLSNPYLKSEDVVKSISLSLFELYHNQMKNECDNIVMLNYQYRMHPEIGNFISDVFYDGKVNMGEDTVKQQLLLPSPYHEPIHFVDTELKPNHFEKRRGQSFINECEADLICNEIIPLINHAGLSDNISLAIITPYSAQCELIKQNLSDSKYSNTVYTIDSIQGMEFDIVIFSFVRSFTSKSNKVVGFLDDMRRLNVSLSRAKKKLILIGNRPTLTRDEAHRGNEESLFNPVQVFKKLTQSYIQYISPSKARLFHERYKLEDVIECSIIRIENSFLYFNVKNDPAFVFRIPLKETHVEYQLLEAKEVLMEITGYSSSLQPLFSISGVLKDGTFEKLKDFRESVSDLMEKDIITCIISKKSRVIMASYKGFNCMMPEGSFNSEYKDENNIGDSVRARVYSIDKEKEIIHVYPLLSSYEDKIRSGEVSRFFFTLDEKLYPNELSLIFDNGEKAYFSISNKYMWFALLEGEVYCDFQMEDGTNNIIYKTWRGKVFRNLHNTGDIISAYVTYIGKICIAWSEGVVGNIDNFKGMNLKIGESYKVKVSYNEKGHIVFTLI